MDITNQKIAFLGDSITEGHGVAQSENIFLNRLQKQYHLQKAINYGIGGTRIAKQLANSGNPVWDNDFIARVEEMDPDVDVVVVFGGTNDFGHGDAPLGTKYDRTPYTFYGACHVLMEKLINKYPAATIVFMTPVHRCNEDNLRGDGGKAQDVAPLSAYVEIIKEVATYYAIPVLDLFATSGIQPKVEVLREKYCPDGLHPSDAGHELIAKRLAGFLQTL